MKTDLTVPYGTLTKICEHGKLRKSKSVFFRGAPYLHEERNEQYKILIEDRPRTIDIAQRISQ